jgi:tetratricopeptide (TPR) repeat protein
MNIKKSILQYFEKKKIAKINATNYMKGLESYERGRKCIMNKDDDGSALDCLNLAIELGFQEAEVYGLRASCLSSLKKYKEAITDFDMAISLAPNKAQEYHGRSLAKSLTGDLEGSIKDLEEAVRLSKIDNANNRWWNQYSKDTHWGNTATEVYEWDLKNELGKKELINKLLTYKSKKD